MRLIGIFYAINVIKSGVMREEALSSTSEMGTRVLETGPSRMEQGSRFIKGMEDELLDKSGLEGNQSIEVKSKSPNEKLDSHRGHERGNNGEEACTNQHEGESIGQAKSVKKKGIREILDMESSIWD